MERATRLRRYLKKDYTQVVEFPVEIVGRDGHVRRYSFDDSVRLYQRRVQSAALRYDDPDLVDAEVRHCRQRIDQLRRSYLEHYGWGPLRDAQLRGVFAGPLAAEVAAFLRRAFGSGQGPGSLALTVLESGLGDVCFVQSSTSERGYLLYVWRIDDSGPPGAKDAYRAVLRRLMAPAPADGVERLYLAHEGPDIALILAGTGEWDGAPLPGPEEEEAFVPPAADGDPSALALRLLYDGNVSEALRVFEAGMEANPAKLSLAQSASLVALLDDQPERGEFAARFGGLHHPDDPLLGYLLTIALYRRGEVDHAKGLVESLPPGMVPLVDALAGMIALSEGRFGVAWRRFGRVVPRGDADPVFPARLGVVARRLLLRRGLSAGLATIAFGAAIGMLFSEQAAYALPILLVAPMIATEAVLDLRARGREAMRGGRYALLRLLSLELLPRERPGASPN